MQELTWQRAAQTPGGYAWWYFDALDAAGDGLVCIFFAGSVFSPSYAARLRRGERALPGEHAAVNLALYRRGRPAVWVMSEYPSIDAGDDRVVVAGSRIEREGDGFCIVIDERTAPYRRRVRGTILVEPEGPALSPTSLAEGQYVHAWQALAPRARVRASFEAPDFALDGLGYHDRNWGDGRLEDAFTRWGWARFHGPRRTSIVYALTDHVGRDRAFAAEVPRGEPGRLVEVAPSAHGELRPGRWGLRLPRSFGVGGLDGGEALHVETDELLEQAPFYGRYRARLSHPLAPAEPPVEGMGEFLDLVRFRSRGIQFLLHFKTWRSRR
jgi:carotenoid 1,2-hydratase